MPPASRSVHWKPSFWVEGVYIERGDGRDNPTILDWYDESLKENRGIEGMPFVKYYLLFGEENHIWIEFGDSEFPVIAGSNKNE